MPRPFSFACGGGCGARVAKGGRGIEDAARSEAAGGVSVVAVPVPQGATGAA